MADISDTGVLVPTTADLPSGEPIVVPPPVSSVPATYAAVAAAPAPSSSPKAPPKRSRPIPLRVLLAATKPANIDAFLTRLNKCLSTPSGIDTVMLFLGYTSHLSASILTGAASSTLLRTKLTTLLLGPVSAAAGLSSSKSPSAGALVLAGRLRALSGLMSEARTILRLWALLPLYFWARGLVFKAFSSSSSKTSEKDSFTPKPTTLETAIEWTRLLLCIALQTLENGAYLSSKGVLGWKPATQGWAFKWSARFWAAYVGIEIGRLAAEGATSGVKKGAADKAEWRSKLARNLAWAPLTVHWSTDGGLVADPVVGLLASIPGIIQIRELWKQNA
ncbi:hypothetical protein B0H63DRAFT_528547 [Podospora didyma]|uniref:Uncharacterized protein n=1 Tax=Podospora didyma TaxID=330526 RepID=A0AAE0N2D3_9PEZI|nr:hypothetical protein B0H63DRAFT_528547 [Podospora didyma]